MRRGGFFPACEDLLARFGGSVPVCTFLFCFLKWRSGRAYQFHSSGPGSVQKFTVGSSPLWLSELKPLRTGVP